ncbi:unnamed protein product [Paramecium sonneborni]|uniref:Inhibitor of apoptosis-promoting Bax1 protein n=1 Tax=Paramecium sonneborni TaxID=65129 RepID=A0A8S1MPC9_9CILI|nr:unnamed protein product [Paramecium sonneborni]
MERDQESVQEQPQAKENDISEAHSVDMSLNCRQSFIRNVYLTFWLQQIAIYLFAYYSIKTPMLREFEAKQVWVLVLISVFVIVLYCYLFSNKIETRKQINKFIWIFVVTLTQGYVISAFCCIISNKINNGNLFIQYLLFMNGIMILGLYLFTQFYPKDFKIGESFLFCFFFGLIQSAFLIYLYRDDIKFIFISLCLILAYSFYLIYDMKCIVEYKRYSVGKDDYILGVFILNIDVFILPIEFHKYLKDGKK